MPKSMKKTADERRKFENLRPAPLSRPTPTAKPKPKPDGVYAIRTTQRTKDGKGVYLYCWQSCSQIPVWVDSVKDARTFGTAKEAKQFAVQLAIRQNAYVVEKLK